MKKWKLISLFVVLVSLISFAGLCFLMNPHNETDFSHLTTANEDPYEDNDTIGTAYYISEQTNYNGWCNDDDWYQIYITSGYGRLQVNLWFIDAEGDIDITVHNSSGSIITGSYSITDNEYIDYTLPTSGTSYYLRIYSFGAYGSSYTLWWDDLSTASPSPRLVYNSKTIDDDTSGNSFGNDNGLIDAGETIELILTLRNIGTISATSISATLSTSDPLINLLDSVENFPSIPAGSTENCLGDYDFIIGASHAGGFVTFTLTITASEGSWTDYFYIYVQPPILEYHSSVIDDDNSGESSGNNDGLANPGESIELVVTIKNTGTATATNVYATLSTSDPLISFLDSFEYFPNIPGGSTGECGVDYDFTIDPSHPGGYVTFTLSISSTGYSWTDTFNILVRKPELEYYSSMFDDDNVGQSSGNNDGFVDTGESIELTVTLENTGTDTATKVNATLSTSDPLISFIDDFVSYPNITAGSTGASLGDYDFTIDPSHAGGVVTFTLTINAAEASWTDTFNILVRVPNLEFNSFSIDDDSSGNSSGNNNGFADAGETIELTVTLGNTGTGLATNISAIISTSDLLISFIDNTENYPDISPGSTGTSVLGYVFQINSSHNSGNVTFTLSITANEGFWTDTFDININEMTIPPSTGIPSFPLIVFIPIAVITVLLFIRSYKKRIAFRLQ